VLVQSGGTFRLSKNSGKSWTRANVYCADPSSCDPIGSGLVGRVVDGVVSLYDDIGEKRNVSAYSLRTNAVIGQPYQAKGEEVLDMRGALVLLRHGDTADMTIRSLVDQTTRTVPGTAPYRRGRLLADGSVMVHDYNKPGIWDIVSAAGTMSPFISADSKPAVSGSVVAFRDRAGRLCLVTPAEITPKCRSGLGAFEIAQINARGVLIQHGTKARWLPISKGTLGAPITVRAKLTRDNYQHAVSAESSYPVIAQKTSSGTRLLTLRPNGRLTVHKLGWALASVLPESLQLTPSTVLGWTGDAKPWYRSALGVLGASKTVGTYGPVVASGGRWAVSGSSIALYDRGKAAGRLKVDGGPDALSGAQVLVNPSCNPPLSDPNPTCPTREIYSVTGRKLATIAADDIFGDLAVVGGGSSNAVQVVRYFGATSTIASFTLPAPDTRAGCTRLKIWGDWVAGRCGLFADAVAYNYRTGAARISSSHSTTVEALGDGFAVIRTFDAANDRQLQVWNLADGSTTTLSSVAGTAATDGSRVAYLSGDPFNRFTKARLTVISLASLARTEPRVLGVVAPATWKKTWGLDVDLTKAVRSGRLEIRDAGGNLVRWLKVPATRDGSLRDLRWDGRDSAGKAVPAGTYTYRLTSLAADGTGAIRAADGTAGPLGSVVVG
jgi:hypothetical protein